MPGVSETKALSKPNNRLNKDDLPEFGGPTNKTTFFNSPSPDKKHLFTKPPKSAHKRETSSTTPPSSIKS